jgi:hypothetical protein
MQILYTSDGEPTTIMSLDTLIANFNDTSGWQYRHNEEDMRFELDSRGWYEGLHECGKYLVLSRRSRYVRHRPHSQSSRGSAHSYMGRIIHSPIALTARGESLRALRQ